MKKNRENLNPIIRSDYPDPDVIRVGDTYYMISTTMHFMPGGVILRSYDLLNWEIASYIFDSLDDSPAERLELESTNYAGGMWAGSLRYHDGMFYAAFISHFSETTYLYTAKDVCDKWEKHTIEGMYHDLSLLFDDDGRKYIVYGNTEIHLTELNDDLTAPKKGGLDRIIIEDKTERILGYEGSHLYKINGKYYLFLINWPKDKEKTWRTESCFVADSLDGEFKGGVVLKDDRGFFGQGVAQGGIVDTPGGKWYSVMFQDSGAVGRMPILCPVTFDKDGFPVFGSAGHIPEDFEVASSRPYYRYEPMNTSDSFVKNDPSKDDYDCIKKQWQWNHVPDRDLFALRPEGGLTLRTGKLCSNLTHARNTLTQRMIFPRCEAEVTIDASGLKNGDRAGLCALQGCYGYLAITREAGAYYLIKVVRNLNSEPAKVGASGDYLPGEVVEKIRLSGSTVTVCLKANFEDLTDKLDFYYMKDNKFVKVGESHQLKYRLDHFTGARYGLFLYATEEIGGEATFTDFVFRS
ncbi:MAG: glycoside hydrolase 43 family protein [Lachnospiraceae bacterium]|nr:glycoside hydrolase 43 family protein [Lachnospiraceae bacterium]